MLGLCFSRFSVYVRRESKLPDNCNTGRNFAKKKLQEAEQFRNQKALWKGVNKLTTRNF